MIEGWWVKEIAGHLQQFYLDFVAGKRPKLALQSHPQSGKSWMALDFIAWVSGRNPNLKTIFASFSDELGVRTNTDLQRIIKSDIGRFLVGLRSVSTAGNATHH